MGNKKSQPVISVEQEEAGVEWNGQFVDCDTVDWGVSEPIADRDNVRTLRATVFGTGGAGKSCLLTKWFCDAFSEEYDPTIENYFRKQILLGDTVYTLEVLDTAGQEEFVAMQESWISDSNLFLLVFSLEDRDSFGYVKHMERKISRIKDGTPFSCVLCGTKKDLAHWSDFDPLLFAPSMQADQLLQQLLSPKPSELVVSYLWEPRHVHYAEAVAFAREKNLFSYVEASSFTGFNVDKVFRILAHCILITNHRLAMHKKIERSQKRGSRVDVEATKGNLERRGSKSALDRRGSKHNLERRDSKSTLDRSHRRSETRTPSKEPGKRGASEKSAVPHSNANQPRVTRNGSVLQLKPSPSGPAHTRSQSGGYRS